jgi:hypothetical protein
MKAAEGAGKGRSSRGFGGKQYEQYEQYRQHEQHKQHGGSNTLAGRRGRLQGKQGVCREEFPGYITIKETLWKAVSGCGISRLRAGDAEVVANTVKYWWDDGSMHYMC